MIRHLRYLVVAMTVALPRVAFSQDARWTPGLDRLVKPQDTVKVWSNAKAGSRRGVVTGVSTDTLWVDGRMFARGSMSRMDVQTGRKASDGRAVVGTLGGLAGGALVLGAVGYHIGGKSCNWECREAGNEGIGQGIGAFLFGTVGAIAGGITGFVLGSREYRRWKQIFP